MKYLRRHNLKAFSLLEVVITIVVLGLLASIAFVGYGTVVTRAARSSTEASLMHIDRAVSVTHAMRTAAEPGIRNDDDFNTAAYGTDGNSDISSSTGTWDLTRATAEMTEGFDQSTVYYTMSESGVTGMAKTVIDSSPDGDRWHLSFLKSSPAQTVTWSAWCAIDPADLLVSPTRSYWPTEECRFEGDFQAGENPFPVENIEGQTLIADKEAVLVGLPTAFDGYADEVKITIQGYENDDQATPIGDPIERTISDFVAGEYTEFTSAADGVVSTKWYDATLEFITADVVDVEYSVEVPTVVQPWTDPEAASFTALVHTGCDAYNNGGTSSCDANWDPQVVVTATPPATSGALPVVDTEYFYREVGSETWLQASGNIIGEDTTLAENTAYEVAAGLVTEDPNGIQLRTPQEELVGVPFTMGTAVEEVVISSSHNPEEDGFTVNWSWTGGADHGEYTKTLGPNATVSSDTTATTGTTDGAATTHTATVESCNDWGCGSDYDEVLVGDRPSAPAVPGAPIFVREDAEPNPDVWFRTSATNTSTNEYRLLRVGTTATFTGTHEFADVGRSTEVCVEQQSRTKNDYGWSDWSLSGPETCHTTGDIPQSCAAPGSITVTSKEEQDLTPRVYFYWTDRNPNYKQQYSRDGGSTWHDISIDATNSGWLNASHSTTPTWKVRAQNTCSNSYGSKLSGWTESNNDSEPVGSPTVVDTPNVSLDPTEEKDSTPRLKFKWSATGSPTQWDVTSGWANDTYRTVSFGQKYSVTAKARRCVTGNLYNRTYPSGSAPTVCSGWDSETKSVTIGRPVGKPSAPTTPYVHTYNREQRLVNGNPTVTFCRAGAHEIDVDKRNTAGTWYNAFSGATDSSGCISGTVYGGSGTYTNAAARRYVWGNEYNRTSPSGSNPKVWSDWSNRSGSTETWLHPYVTGFTKYFYSSVYFGGSDTNPFPDSLRAAVSFNRNGWTGGVKVHYYWGTCTGSRAGGHDTNNNSYTSNGYVFKPAWISVNSFLRDVYSQQHGALVRASADNTGGHSVACRTSTGWSYG